MDYKKRAVLKLELIIPSISVKVNYIFESICQNFGGVHHRINKFKELSRENGIDIGAIESNLIELKMQAGEFFQEYCDAVKKVDDLSNKIRLGKCPKNEYLEYLETESGLKSRIIELKENIGELYDKFVADIELLIEDRVEVDEKDTFFENV